MKQFSCQGKLYSNSMQTSNILSGVEKHNDDAKKLLLQQPVGCPSRRQSTGWKSCVSMPEKGGLTLSIILHTGEGGIEAHRSETREAHLHQMNILKHDYSTAGGQLHV